MTAISDDAGGSQAAPLDFGETWACRFPFTSGRRAKARPVLVIRDLDLDCLVCRITSAPHFGFLDYSPVEWKVAGLDKPSTIRLSRLVTIEKTLLRARIGMLAADDREAARRLWNEKFRL
jgi:mRNA interferase MazF